MSGDAFRVGDLVWVQVKGHPVWPGQVMDPAKAPKAAREAARQLKKKEDATLVAFFGDSSFGWFEDDVVLPFKPHIDTYTKQRNARQKVFKRAVEEATELMVRREGGAPATNHDPPDFLNPRQGDFAEEESDEEEEPLEPLAVPPPPKHDDAVLAALQPSAALDWLRSVAQDPGLADPVLAEGGLVLSLRAAHCIDPEGSALTASRKRPRSDSKASKQSSKSRTRRPPSEDDDDIAALLASDSEEEAVPKSRRGSLARQASSKGRRRRGLFVREADGFLVVKQTLDTTLQQLHRMAQDPSAWYPEEATDAPHPLRVMLLRYREAAYDCSTLESSSRQEGGNVDVGKLLAEAVAAAHAVAITTDEAAATAQARKEKIRSNKKKVGIEVEKPTFEFGSIRIFDYVDRIPATSEAFHEALQALYTQHDAVLPATQIFEKAPLDLYAVFKLVAGRGGFAATTVHKQWKKVGIEYRPELESQPNMSFHLKERYFRYLFAYEQQLTADAPFQEEAIKTPSDSGRKRRLRKRSSSMGDMEDGSQDLADALDGDGWDDDDVPRPSAKKKVEDSGQLARARAAVVKPKQQGLPTGAELARLRGAVSQDGRRLVRITYQQGQVLPSKAQVRHLAKQLGANPDRAQLIDTINCALLTFDHEFDAKWALEHLQSRMRYYFKESTPSLELVHMPPEHAGGAPFMHPPARPWAPAPLPSAPRMRPAAVLPAAGAMETPMDPRTQLAVPTALVGIPQLQAMPPLNLPLMATAPTDPRAVPMAPAEGGTMLNIDPNDLAAILTNAQLQQGAASAAEPAAANEDVGGQLLSLLDGLKDGDAGS